MTNWRTKHELSLKWVDSHGEPTGWTHVGTIPASRRTREDVGVLPCWLWALNRLPAFCASLVPAGERLEGGKWTPWILVVPDDSFGDVGRLHFEVSKMEKQMKKLFSSLLCFWQCCPFIRFVVAKRQPRGCVSRSVWPPTSRECRQCRARWTKPPGTNHNELFRSGISVHTLCNWSSQRSAEPLSAWHYSAATVVAGGP